MEFARDQARRGLEVERERSRVKKHVLKALGQGRRSSLWERDNNGDV